MGENRFNARPPCPVYGDGANTKPPLEPDTVRAYVEAGGGFCPFCEVPCDEAGSIDTEGEGHVLYCELICPGCKCTWREVYRLVDVQ